MKRIHILAAATTIIGVFSVLVFFLEAMALTDIIHGEQDVRLECGVADCVLRPAPNVCVSPFGTWSVHLHIWILKDP